MASDDAPVTPTRTVLLDEPQAADAGHELSSAFGAAASRTLILGGDTFDEAGFGILDAKIHTTLDGYALDTYQVVASSLSDHYRELIAMVENELPMAIDAEGALPPPGRGRLSRRVRSFPVTPRVELHPDDKGQHWLLSVSASDRNGLLYCIARVLARHHVNLHLAKVMTLGERVEDTFLISGPGLHAHRHQAQLTQDLLQALEGDL